MAYLVSPSIEYNTGDMGPEVYFRPEVDNSVGSIRMHGHRIIFVDIFTQIALILSDASGDTVSQATTGTNQYMFYTKKAGDSSGTWKAQFVSTETYKWQLYYAHYYNANARSSVPMTEDGFYFGDNNRVYQFSVAESYRLNSLPPEVVDMTQLNAQVSNHQFNWWFIISPPKGYCYCSPQRAVSQALLLARYKAVLLESSRLDSSACSFIYF